MRAIRFTSTAFVGLFALSACVATPPPGPSILAQPGRGKTAQQFQAEDARCKQDAARANGGVTPAQAASQSGFGTAAIGTVLGAGIGALLGAAGGNPGAGAAVGAGGGLLLGSAFGADNAQRSAGAFQQSYDSAYAQCTAASGNVIMGPPIREYGGGPDGFGGYAPGLMGPPPPPPPPGYGYGW